MYAQDSIDLLTKSGIDFKRHEEHGIDVQLFGEVLISSGMVLLDDVKWISFHRCVDALISKQNGLYRFEVLKFLLWISGYDFGYLFKLLTCKPLPADETEFFGVLTLYFPCIYDIKYLMKSCKNLKGGLQDVADDLGVSLCWVGTVLCPV
jgi:CCR4-NOT transcription complex subunit 7/8